MRRTFLILFLFLYSQRVCAEIEFQAQMGKRWLEAKDRIHASDQSYVFAVHGKFSVGERLRLIFGPSFVLDHYKSTDHCDEMGCFTLKQHKFGADLGTEFSFPLLTVFVHGRFLVHSKGRYEMDGRTKIKFKPALNTFNGGTNEGDLHTRSTGFNLTSGVKFPLIDKLDFMVSFEMAYEKTRTESGNLIVRNNKGDSVHLNESLETDWMSNNSSALYLGLAYTL